MTKQIFHQGLDERGRLHCDNPACGHILSLALPWSDALIGFPCPKCGSDMLTRADFERSERFTRWIAWINKWFGWLGSEPSDAKFSMAVRHIPGGVESRITKRPTTPSESTSPEERE